MFNYTYITEFYLQFNKLTCFYGDNLDETEITSISMLVWLEWTLWEHLHKKF